MRADVIAKEYAPDRVIKTKRMLLLGAMVSIVMLFAALISAYIVTRGGANFWVNIKIPYEFWVSTALILASSFTIFLAVHASKKNNKSLIKVYLILTFLLGLGFAVSQYQGFNTLADRGLNFTGNSLEHLKGTYGEDYFITNFEGVKVPMIDGHFIDPDDASGTKIIDHKIHELKNPASSYLVFIIGLHVVHVVGGLLYLLFLVIYSFFGQIERFNYLKIRQIGTYWHFVDLLWILLLLFLYFIH